MTGTPRNLPGIHASCDRCGAGIVWATTTARESGPGGKAMPLDPIENPDGNVAAWRGHGRRVLARVLTRDEQPDAPLEYHAMPHFATCRRQR